MKALGAATLTICIIGAMFLVGAYIQLGLKLTMRGGSLEGLAFWLAWCCAPIAVILGIAFYRDK